MTKNRCDRFTETDLKFLRLMSREYPTVSAASGQIINFQAKLKLPKGTEHFMSDLHGENEAFEHILNNASGVIREKIETVLGDTATDKEKAEFATLIYYPSRKLEQIKARQNDLDGWYWLTMNRLIALCRLVASKHSRTHVRACLPENYAYILDELLHAHFEDHDKNMYYGRILSSIIENECTDDYICSICQVIQRLAVDKLHIVGDLFDRGPRTDRILDRLMAHHSVDIQWGNHDVVWMGAASGSPICIATVLKTSFAWNNVEELEDGYNINLRRLALLSEIYYGQADLTLWMPRVDEARQKYPLATLQRCARLNKAITIIMMKLECQICDRNPEFQLAGRDFLRHIDYQNGTVELNGKTYPLLDRDFPTVDPEHPEQLNPTEQHVLDTLVRTFKQSEKLQKHVQFLYAKGSLYKVENGNLLYHGAMPMNPDGSFASETFQGKSYSGKALFDYCDRRARQGYFAREGSPERLAGQDFLWYLWCGRLSPLFGRSAMTTFERAYIEDPATHTEQKDPYYSLYDDEAVDLAILKEFGLEGPECHIINGHVPVRTIEGESPIKGNGRLLVIDGGFCRAYHEKTGIAGYTLVFNSRGMYLRTHQPFESVEKAIMEDEDILSRVTPVYRCQKRLYVQDTDGGAQLQEIIDDLKLLVQAYQKGLVSENPATDTLPGGCLT